MRLHTYGTLIRAGWLRRGTNTYVNAARLEPEIVERLAGNECIGASHYEAFLLAVGPQAISSLPGARVENRVDIEGWCQAMERGEHPFHLTKCSDSAQRDTGLWVFPLRWEGLPRERFERMRASLSDRQLTTLDAFEREGLVTSGEDGYQVSLLGEVFMGHLVHDLKGDAGRCAVDEYIAEGQRLGEAIRVGQVRDENQANNRQVALPVLRAV